MKPHDHDLCVAAMSDIHGNRWALEAVLRDIDRRGIENIVNLGDCLYGPLDPAGTADILMERNMTTVRGNEDRILVDPGPDANHTPSLDFTRSNLNKDRMAWVESLPKTAVVFDRFFLCHALPNDDSAYLFFKIEPTGGVVLKSSQEISDALASITQSVVLCGHDHLPRVLTLPDGKCIVNPGSVGCPAYFDDHPYPHAMESGSHHARYAIITRQENGWRAEHIAVPYDWKAAASAALKNGRPDWAEWLTGKAAVSKQGKRNA